MFVLLCIKMQLLMSMLLISGAEDRGVVSGGEDDHLEARRFAGEEIENERGSETEIGTVNEIGIERGNEKEGLDAQEGHHLKGNACLGGRCN